MGSSGSCCPREAAGRRSRARALVSNLFPIPGL
jgi:hypothetical protein